MRWIVMTLLLVSCSSKTPWKESEIAQSKRYTLEDRGPLQFELIVEESDLDAYLTLNLGSFKVSNEGLSRLRIEAGDHQFDTSVPCYAGGQRVKLPSRLLYDIASLYPSYEMLTIRLPGYKLSVQVDNILRTYHKIWGNYEQAKQIARDDNDRCRYGRDQ